jgi:hypothetical protein
MALRELFGICAVLATFIVAGLDGSDSGSASAQMATTQTKPAYSPIKKYSVPYHLIGLWDKPNEACMTKCQVHVRKGCFKRLSDKYPAANAEELQDKCDDTFSLCLYDCMCDTCDENQIIIKEQQLPNPGSISPQ